MRFVIHAGVHKTGSGTIQSFLAKNAEILRSHGVYYAVGFFRRFTRQHPELSFAIRRGELAPVRDFFEQVPGGARRSPIHTVIVSGEELSLLGADGLQTLKSEMLASDPAAEAEILLYFRNRYDVAISLVQHRARTTGGSFTATGMPR